MSSFKEAHKHDRSPVSLGPVADIPEGVLHLRWHSAKEGMEINRILAENRKSFSEATTAGEDTTPFVKEMALPVLRDSICDSNGEAFDEFADWETIQEELSYDQIAAIVGAVGAAIIGGTSKKK